MTRPTMRKSKPRYDLLAIIATIILAVPFFTGYATADHFAENRAQAEAERYENYLNGFADTIAKQQSEIDGLRQEAAEQSATIDALREQSVEQSATIRTLRTPKRSITPTARRVSPSRSVSRAGNTRTSAPKSVQAWRPLVAAYFPASQVNNALSVMFKESGGNPRARNTSTDCRGLFQLYPPDRGWAAAGYDPYNPATNVRLAAKKWRAHGWSAWSVKP